MPKIGYANYVKSSGRDQALPFNIGTSIRNRRIVNTRDSPFKLVVAAAAAIILSWKQQQKIVGNDTFGNDLFGYSVAIDRDTVIVGARDEDSSGNNAGAAYIFTRTGSTWKQQQKIVGVDTSGNDKFGYSVAIDGDTVIVGAFTEDSSGNDAGAAYIFTRSVNVWSQQQKIVGVDTSGNDQFGYSVAIDGDTVIVGAIYEDSSGNDAGAAYIFTRSENVWSHQQKIVGNDTSGNDFFGNSVAIDGDTVIVGAATEDSSGYNAGAAYIFTRTGIKWTQQAKIVGVDTSGNDLFGYSVAIDGYTVIVGAVSEDSSGDYAGAAYIFTRTGSTWKQQQKIVGNDTSGNDQFGYSVAIDGDTVIVGARIEDSSGNNAGAAYIFTRSVNVWSQQQKIVGEDTKEYDYFGTSVAIDGDTVIVGRVNVGFSVIDAGAAYIFTYTS